MHAAGHASVAWLVGPVLRVGFGGASPVVNGSTRLPSLVASEDPAVFVVVVAALALALRAVGHVVSTWAGARLSSRVGSDLRVDVVCALLAVQPLRTPRHGDQGVARVATRPSEAAATAALTTLTRETEEGLGRGALGMARAAAQLLPLAAVAVALSPRLALVSVLVWAPFGLVLARARRASKRALVAAAAETEELHGAAADVARHVDLWRVYGASRRVVAHVGRLGARIAQRTASIEARAAAMTGANEVLGAIALAGVVALARAGVLGLRIAEVLPFMAVFFLAYKPVREWGDGRVAWARGSAALARIRATIDRAEPNPASPAPEAEPAWPLADLDVRGLAAPPGLSRPVDLHAEAGSIVAVVGATGAGKSTLLRALLGLEPGARGEVRYAGRSLQDAPIGPAARPFAWAPQDAPVVADTVRANVELGGAGGDAALAKLGVDLPVGDRVGAGARALSGGERVWIGLARALASGLPVLLLDEPTTGLDREAAARALDAIAALRGRRTVVLVTHDPRARALADRVVELSSSPGATEEAA